MESVEQVQDWYVAYTQPRAEKKADLKLRSLGIEAYLPTRKVKRQWKDRIKVIEEPLFPSYIFVKIPPAAQYKVCNQREIVKFVTFGAKPVKVEETVVQSLISVRNENEIEVTTGCEVDCGDLVQIAEGHLCGLSGYVTAKTGNNKVAICVEVLNRTVTVTLPADSILVQHELEVNLV